jgi:hypothetical protein
MSKIYTQNRKLFIHIGQHKTGSSSIQKALIENKKILKKNNISYFRVNPDKTLGSNISPWIQPKDLEDFKGVGKVKHLSELSLNISKLSGNVIISSESFSWVNDKKELMKIKEKLNKYFKEIIIIVYLRRQDSHAVSHSQEEAKRGGKFSFFLRENNTMLEHHKDYDYYLNYNNRLSIWADIFGKSAIIIRIFEEKYLYKKDVVLDFFKVIGIIDNVLSFKVNETWGFEKIKVIYLIEKIKMNKYFKYIITKNLDNSGKLLPSRKQAKEFYSFYKNSNKKLNTKFSINENNESIFNEDFSMYPEVEKDIWTEDSANQAILNILKSVNNLTPKTLLYIAIKIKILALKEKFKKFYKDIDY